MEFIGQIQPKDVSADLLLLRKSSRLSPFYSFDLGAARIYAELWAQMLAKGFFIGAHDLMIGSTALALGFSVATFNPRHFGRIEGLQLEIITKVDGALSTS